MSSYTTARSGNFPIHILFNPSPNNKDLYVKEIAYFRYTPGEACAHKCKGFCIHYILSGKLKVNGIIIDKSHAYLHSGDTDYTAAAVCDSPREEVSINFSGHSAHSLLKKLNLDTDFSVFPSYYNDKIGDIIKEAIHSDYTSKNIDYSLLSILYSAISYLPSRTFSQIIHPITPQSDYSNVYIQKACSYIENNYFKQITVADIALHVNISTGHLLRLFKQILNRTPQRYLTGYRMHIAKTLLVETTMSISEIANAVGYPDARHFSQLFRSRSGFTPSQYRKIVERDRQNDIEVRDLK